MKQQHRDVAIENALAQLKCMRAEVGVEVSQSTPVWQVGHQPPLIIREHRILYELFKQEPGLESRSKDPEGGRKIIILRPRG
ncbi:MAG: hypothetical protein JRC99_11745 [Deltaproteobacteria bacterium]|nr:hypothetical protein [Deltaproteobacteria bacterium]